MSAARASGCAGRGATCAGAGCRSCSPSRCVIAIGTGLYAGLGGMREWRERSERRRASPRSRTTTCASTCARAASCAPGALRARAERAAGAGVVRAREERLVVPDPGRRLAPGGRTVLVPGQIVGMTCRAARPSTRSGPGAAGPCGPATRAAPSRCSSAASRATTACRPRAPCASPAGDGCATSGRGCRREYFLVSAPRADFGGRGDASRWCSRRCGPRSALAGRAGRVNELLVRLAPGADAAAVRPRRASRARAGAARRRHDRHARRPRSAPTASSTTTPQATSGS